MPFKDLFCFHFDLNYMSFEDDKLWIHIECFRVTDEYLEFKLHFIPKVIRLKVTQS